MFNELFRSIYLSHISKGGLIVDWVEDEFRFSAAREKSINFDQSEQEIYKSFFSSENQSKFYLLYCRIRGEMVGVPYSRCEKLIGMLAFMQEILATALWKHNQRVEVDMENFAREFDRLDIEDERFRLYESVQKRGE
ncbi:hypothetical protein [Acidovorax sp. SUPP3334]|uniref:hypothetical protein n=1 Tax=Acidovorax sp. SUPP3334 TaxID=2920881 RepID=UPI0023DE3F8B|nr:hypothetical protein [Acidovorax sp. SUPP3334]GKT26114.1 hypothetical protein AVHM3334_20105 [Acidovorax sp. SUPP3334]